MKMASEFVFPTPRTLVMLRRNKTNMQKLIVAFTEGLHWDVRPFLVYSSLFSFLSSQFQMLFSNFLSQLFIYLLKGMTEILNQAFKLSSGFLTFCHIYTCKSTNSRYVTGALRRVFRFVFWSGNAILEKGIQDTVRSGHHLTEKI